MRLNTTLANCVFQQFKVLPILGYIDGILSHMRLDTSTIMSIYNTYLTIIFGFGYQNILLSKYASVAVLAIFQSTNIMASVFVT